MPANLEQGERKGGANDFMRWVADTVPESCNGGLEGRIQVCDVCEE